MRDGCILLDSGTMAVSDIISDHRATYVSIKIDLKLSSSYFREVWNYKHPKPNLKVTRTVGDWPPLRVV